MARKKSTIVDSNAEIREVFKEEEVGEEKKLSVEEYMGLKLHDSRVDLQKAIREKFEFQEQILMHDYNVKRDLLRRKQVEASASMDEAKRDYNLLLDKVQKRLGIELKNYIVKDDGSLILFDNRQDN